MFEYHTPNPSLLDKLERRFGWIAIPRLPLVILMGQALVLAFSFSDPSAAQHLNLNPVLVLQGEWWRLVTFVLIPPPTGILFAFFWFSFFWFICQSLEAQWGSFKTCLYVILGWASQLLASFVALFIWHINLVQEGQQLLLSLQLAFAFFFPEYVIYVFFVLPLKMRVMAWINAAFLLYQAVTGWPSQAVIVAASMANYLLFFAADHARSVKNSHESGLAKAAFSRRLNLAVVSAKAHTCVECGKDPNQADIRLCSCARCGEDGKFWCLEHLKPHLGQT